MAGCQTMTLSPQSVATAAGGEDGIRRWKPTINAWQVEDHHAHKKQRRTARTVFQDPVPHGTGGHGPSTAAGRPGREVLDVLEDRNGSGSTLMVTQIPIRQWHSALL